MDHLNRRYAGASSRRFHFRSIIAATPHDWRKPIAVTVVAEGGALLSTRSRTMARIRKLHGLDGSLWMPARRCPHISLSYTVADMQTTSSEHVDEEGDDGFHGMPAATRDGIAKSPRGDRGGHGILKFNESALSATIP